MPKKWLPSQGRIPAGQSEEARPFVMSDMGSQERPLQTPESCGSSTEPQDTVDAAYQKGYQAGLDAGAAQVRKEMEEECRALTAIIHGVEQLRGQIYDQTEQEIISLVMHIVRKVLRIELEHHPEAIVDIVKESIRRAVDREVLKVSVNARDFETINHRRPELLHSQDGIKKIVIEVDETIQPGGCLIETRYGDVDARLDRQVEVIGDELRKASQGH